MREQLRWFHFETGAKGERCVAPIEPRAAVILPRILSRRMRGFGMTELAQGHRLIAHC